MSRVARPLINAVGRGQGSDVANQEGCAKIEMLLVGACRGEALSLRYVFSAGARLVAQICNLLYRRIAFCGATKMPGGQGCGKVRRMQTCATKAGAKTHAQLYDYEKLSRAELELELELRAPFE